MQAQMIVDSLIGYVPPDNRTTPTSLALNETVMSIPITIENRTVIEAKTNEKGNAKDAENIVMVNATTADGIGSGNSQAMTMLQVVEKATSPKPIAPEDLIIVHELLTETVSLPAVHEDDEIDLEERHTTTLRPRNSTKSEYKIKDKVATAVVV
ncbi:unnamed protein product [Orchesella dallaii]|uniref:Uncharacterized protein n=1 Tax=Orchesella dallaii TaxID=48710 RepID=A0ABP1RZQ2_9HEXA